MVEPLVHKIVSKAVCSEPGAPQMSNPSSRSAASVEIHILAGEKARCLLWILPQLVRYFSYRTVKGPGNLTSSGTASLILLIRPRTASCLWL